MRSYEAVVIFSSDEEQYSRGKEIVRQELQNVNATISSENDMGQRALAYPIKKQDRGHYYLFNTEVEPESVVQVERSLRLKSEVLKFLFVRKDQ